jgi:hypothetical protein
MRPGLRFKVLTRDNYTCRYCGGKAPNVELHVDHIVPKARGGRDELSNLVTSCRRCNLGKHASLIEQALPEPSSDEYKTRIDELLELARSTLWQDMNGIWDEWEDFVGRRPTKREKLVIADLVLWFGYNGVRRAMTVIAARDGIYPGSDEAAELDLFEVRQTLMRWRMDWLA